ncbi:MAG: NAD(P)-dependent glycerol-1-phosphate dehydrogenase [Candidatus Heimdallarchaeota archaeon]|nr:NAD(P)-dependent glycerol-1-phosphate dehydrogenase [Candidatus Heimdallarchaeota archaeon]MCG3255023.1 NAD(P)-dependent glycerol-1-phosphate dehydrogenase [Candidatus Heimdallarchaeota archaeon]MCK4610097.1 NAD(P)-dependent glycerol-1-phosphate dehydrogenase [Candidatus Heimdallarchaeota archaeon]
MANITNEFKFIELPTLLCLGADMLNSLPEIIDRLSLGSKALLITDDFLRLRIGKEVEDILSDSENHSVYTSTIQDSTLDEVDKQLRIHEETQPDFVIGLGGGKPIDIAKFVAFKSNQRFISIPTIASHDGVASSRASIIGSDKRHSIQTLPPIAVVADTKILDKSPYKFTAAGCGDIIAKKTAIKDWLLSHRLKNEPISEYSIALSDMTVQLITKNADLIKSQAEGYSRIVVKALISSSLAMCVAGSSRPGSGSEHMFSHALDTFAEKPALHGEQCALGTIMMAYLHDLDWENIRSVMHNLGLSTRAKDFGLKDEEIIKALKIAHTIRPQRFTILGKDGLTHEAAVNTASVTGVIS